MPLTCTTSLWPTFGFSFLSKETTAVEHSTFEKILLKRFQSKTVTIQQTYSYIWNNSLLGIKPEDWLVERCQRFGRRRQGGEKERVGQGAHGSPQTSPPEGQLTVRRELTPSASPWGVKALNPTWGTSNPHDPHLRHEPPKHLALNTKGAHHIRPTLQPSGKQLWKAGADSPASAQRGSHLQGRPACAAEALLVLKRRLSGGRLMSHTPEPEPARALSEGDPQAASLCPLSRAGISQEGLFPRQALSSWVSVWYSVLHQVRSLI